MSKQQHPSQRHRDIASCKNSNIATELRHIAAHHIDSFNYMIDTGLQKIAEHMTPVEIHATEKVMSTLEDKKYFFPFTRLKVSIPELKLGFPQKPDEDMAKD